jgi:predicted GNAT superfamily acetyltransferase
MMDGKIVIRRLTTPDEMVQAEELQRVIWPDSEIDIIPSHAALAISHNGGLVLGAMDGDKVVGYILGFLSTTAGSQDEVTTKNLKHCSHQMGVLPDYRHHSLGYRLKLAQREAVLQQGIGLITWTYDPLMSLNAHQNIRKLGAVCNIYLRNYYGSMRDSLNEGLPSDRFRVEWWIASDRVVARMKGTHPTHNLDEYVHGGAQQLNPASYDSRNLLNPCERLTSPESSLTLVEIPSDFQILKKTDVGLTQAWQKHTREIFEGAFAAGYAVTDFIYLKDERRPRSYYVLSQGNEELG